MDIPQLIAFTKETQGSLKWDTASLIRLGGLLAVKVNMIQNLTGQEKGKLVCQVLKTVLGDIEKKEKAEEGKTEEEKKMIEEQFASLQKTVDDVVPASLDLALAAARGKLDLKKVKLSVWVRYFSCCARSIVTVLASQNVISQSQAKDALTAVEKVAEKAAEAAESAESAESSQEDKTHFEQANPMHTPSEEGAKTESKGEESPKPSA